MISASKVAKNLLSVILKFSMILTWHLSLWEVFIDFMMSFLEMVLWVAQKWN